MRTSHLGALEVSVVGLGCNNFGRALDEAGSATVVEAALEAGITHFDTASNYGEGRSEAYLGAALGAKRTDVVVTTKFGVPVAGVPGSGGARPEYIRSSVARSLEQLGTDYIDLLLLHKPDAATPIADTLTTMTQLVEDGTVVEIGCSNLDAGQLEAALAVSQREGLRRFVCNQVEYSLIHRDPETNGLADVCRRNNVALIPFYPLANGLLTGKTRRGHEPKGRLTMDRYQRYLTSDNFDVAEALETFASDRDLAMSQVALAWLIARDVVPCVIQGATRPDQVVANAAAASWQPTSAELDELESLVR